MRAALIALVAVVGLALGAAWAGPLLLDWNSYRGTVEALASHALGQEVRIAGPIALRVLPQPMLTASGVSVAEGGATITARELSLRVAFAPLLSGRLDARELVLGGVDMRVPWPLPPGSLHPRPPQWLSTVSARVEDARLQLGELVFTHISGALSTGDLSGSYAVRGVGDFSGRTWRFGVHLSRPGSDGSAALDVSLDGQGKAGGIGGTFSGQIQGDGTLAGRVMAQGADLSLVMPAPAAPFRAEGRFTLAGGLAAADELAGEIGGVAVRGAVALRVAPSARLDVALTASRLDLDAWLPVLLRAAGTAPPLPMGIDLSAEAAPFAGGTLRGLRAAFDLDGNGLAMRELRVMLPGEARLRAAGLLTAGPHFDGTASLAAPALRLTLGWAEAAGLMPAGLRPEGALRAAELSGHAVLDPGRVALDQLAGTLDGGAVTGRLAVRAAARPLVTADLDFDRLDLDAWLPAQAPPLPALADRLGFDGDVQIAARQARLLGTAFDRAMLQMDVAQGRVTLRRLDAQLAGMQFGASGTLGEGGRIADGRIELRAPRVEQVTELLPEPVASFLATAPGFWHGPFIAQVQVGGAPEALALRVTAELADLRLEAQPVLDLSGGSLASLRWSGPVTLRHPGAPRLAEQLGLTGAPGWLGDGSLALVAQMSGRPARVAADNFDITAGGLRAKGTLALDRTGGALLTGRIAAESLPLPLPAPRALSPLPLGWMRGWRASVHVEAGRVLLGASPVAEAAFADVTLADGALRVQGLGGRIAGGGLAGAIGLDAAAAPPRLSVALAVKGARVAAPLFDLPFDLAGGTVDAKLDVTAAGYAPAAMLASLAGTFTLDASGGVLMGLDLGRTGSRLAEPDLAAVLAGGSAGFDHLGLAAVLAGGIARIETARLTSPSGELTARGSVDLPGNAMDVNFQFRPAVPDPPAIGLQLTGPLTKPVRTPDLAGLTRWHAEHP